MTHDTVSPWELSSPRPIDQILGFLHALLQPVPGQQESEAPRQRGRPALLSADHLWLALLLSLLQGGPSFARIWRLITWSGVGLFPLLSLTRAAVRKRLLALDLWQVQDLLRRVSAALLPWTAHVQDESLLPWAPAVLALDQSTLDAVRRTCEDVREERAESPRLLVGKLLGLFDVRRQQWVRLLFRDDVYANEKLFVEALFGGLQQGAVIVGDLGFFSFPWFDWLHEQGYHWLWRLREKTSFVVEHVFWESEQGRDRLVWLGAFRADRARYLVRLIEYEHAGVWYQYLTDLTDPRQFTILDAAQLYARRWDIELAFKLLKRTLGLHLWWSSQQVLVLAQLFAALMLAQILHALHLKVAAEAGVPLFEVSLPVLVTLLASAPTLPCQQDVLTRLVEQGRVQGLIRPSRRLQPSVPAVCWSQYRWPPQEVRWQRDPRYARRTCGPRSNRVCFQPRFFPFFLI